MVQPVPARRPAAEAAPAAVRLAGLGNRFVELFARKLSRQDLAAEIARLIAAATRARAAAILGFDPRRDRLLLLGDSGLSPEARVALGAGGDCAWDIPLRGLRNRRISVIAAAHQNPFVPRGLVAMSSGGLSIASLPIYNEAEPTGVLLLLAVGSRAFPDAQLQLVSQALRVCARALRDHTSAVPRAEATARDTANIAAAIAELAGELPSAAPADGALAAVPSVDQPPSDERVQRLEALLALAREDLERAHITSRKSTLSLNTLTRERDQLAQRLAEVETDRETSATGLRAELEVLQERLLAVESERGRYQRLADDRHTRAQQTIKTLGTERDTLLERVQNAEAKVTVLDGALGAVKGERTRLSAQVENLSGQVRAAQEALGRAQARHADELVAIEADRESWKEQAAAVRRQLTQRTEEAGALDRDLRSTTVARDGAVAQLQAARAELARLTTLNEDAGRTLSGAETARASAVAETAALNRILEAERAEQATVEQELRGELAARRADLERSTGELDTLRAELATRTQTLALRDQQLAQLRREQRGTQEAEATWAQTDTARRAEIATLTATIEQLTEARQQLLGERAALHAAMAEARQQASDADVAHAANTAELQSVAAQLRRQVETLTGERVGLAGRLERAVEEGKTLARGLAEAQRRSEQLGEQLRQREAAAAGAAGEREQLAAQVATLTGQLHASQEAAHRAHARDVQERTALAADRDEWRELSAAARHQLAQTTERILVLEGELRGAQVARDAIAIELESATAEVQRVAGLHEALAGRLAELEAASAAAAAESAELRRALDDTRSARHHEQQAWQGTQAESQAERERLAADAAALRTEVAAHTDALADRDQQLTGLRSELELLRQQSVDRGVLAHQVNELGATVVELEQQLATARGEGARAERQRVALTEKLSAARQREAELLAAATGEHAALEERLQQLAAERDRLRVDAAALREESAAEQRSAAELQSALEALRAEHRQAQEARARTTASLVATQQQLDALTAALHQTEAEAATQSGERQRLAVQLDAAVHAAAAAHAALEAAQAQAAEERTAFAGERDTWSREREAAHTEHQRLAHALEELSQRAGDLDSTRAAALAERAVLADSLASERAAAARLRDERASLRAAVDRLTADASGLQAAVAERDAQLAASLERETTLQQEATALQDGSTTLRRDCESLGAQLEERNAHILQLRDRHAALERQLALLAATHGEEEQALANGMQAAREQVAQLEAERQALQAALSEIRQQMSGVQSAHAARLAEAQADAQQLRKQLKALTTGRAEVTKRLERAEHALQAQTARADGDRRRAETLGEQNQQLHEQLTAAQGERATIAADVEQLRGTLGRLTAQLDGEAVERDRLRAERDDLERQLAQQATTAAEQTRLVAEQLDAARTAAARLEAERATQQAAHADLEQRFQEAHSAQTAALTRAGDDATALRQQLAALATVRDALSEQLGDAQQALASQQAHVESESRHAAQLGEQNTQLQERLAAAEQRQATLEGAVKQAGAEIDALRQQSEDRGLLAHEASELGARVVALEQQLAAVRGEAAHAERQREAVAEELAGVRRQQSEAEASASDAQAKLHTIIERLSEDRRRLEHENAVRTAEGESQRTTLDELRSTVARASADADTAAQHLAATQRRADELAAQLRQRDAAIETANVDRQRLSTQVAKLAAQVRTTQETLDAVNGRTALEHAAIEAERQAFAEKQAADRSELQRLAAVGDELAAQVAALESARTAAAAEVVGLRRTLDEVRALHHEAEATLRTELAARQGAAERLSSDLLVVRGELAERDELLALVWQEQEAARNTDAERQQTIAALRGQIVTASVQAQEAAEECAHLRDERDAVQRQLAVIEAARGEEGQVLTQGLQTARAQVAQLEQERRDARAALEEVGQRLAHAETGYAELRERTVAEVAELRQQLALLTDTRSALGQRVEQMQEALRQQSEQVDSERGRAGALAERCGDLEHALGAVESQRTTLHADVQRLTAEVAALRDHSADRGALARQVSELTSASGMLEEQLAELRRQTVHTEQRRAALQEELEAARQEQARLRDAAAQQETTLQTMLQQLTEERARLVAERTAQQHQLDAQHITVAELQTALEHAQADRQRIEEDGRDTAQRLGEAHRRLDELGERVRQRETALEAANTERQRFEHAMRDADARVAELTGACDMWRQRAEAASRSAGELAASADADDFVVRMECEAAAAPVDTPLVIERSAPLDELLDAAPEAADSAAAAAEPEPEPEPATESHGGIRLAQEMVLLDASGRGDEAYHVLKGAGFEVTRAAAGDAAVDDLAARKISCVMLNLAAGPIAWRTLKLLRERTGTRTIPVLAYLMGPDSQKGFCFGRADFGIWPMDGERLTERLAHLQPKLKRLLAVSADIDGMGRLREPLTRAGISTSNVLDGKQALEFASMVQPEAALFHLSPSCAGVARAMTALRAGESMRDMPMAVLLDKTLAREEAFYAITARELISKGTFVFANLPAELARLLA